MKTEGSVMFPKRNGRNFLPGRTAFVNAVPAVRLRQLWETERPGGWRGQTGACCKKVKRRDHSFAYPDHEKLKSKCEKEALRVPTCK